MITDIDVYKLDKTYVGTYATAKDVSESLGIPIGSVYAVLTKNSNRKSTYGYQLLKSGEEPLDLMGATTTKAKKAKKVYHYSLDGKELLAVYDSTLDASEKIGELAQSGVSSICNKRRLTSSTTYNLRFEGDEPQDILSDKLYSVYDLKGKEFLGEYSSLEDVLTHYGIPLTDIKDSKQTKYKNIDKGIQVVKNRYLSQLKEINYYKVAEVSSKKDKESNAKYIGKYGTLEEVGNTLGVVRERVRQAVKGHLLIKGKFLVEKV